MDGMVLPSALAAFEDAASRFAEMVNEGVTRREALARSMTLLRNDPVFVGLDTERLVCLMWALILDLVTERA